MGYLDVCGLAPLDRLDHGFVAARKVTRALSECEEGRVGSRCCIRVVQTPTQHCTSQHREVARSSYAAIVTKYIADVRAEIPNVVVARRWLAQDDRTTELVLVPEGGSWRSIQVTFPGRDKGEASAEAIRLLREVLGDAVTGELWVEEINEA